VTAEATVNTPNSIKPPKSLCSLAGKAIADFNMIQAGDRILLGLSGGKDSLSLLHLLLHFKARAPVQFDLGVVTVDPQHDAFDPAPLQDYVPPLGISYHYRSEPIARLAETHLNNDSYCAFCARMRRGVMYGTPAWL